MHLEYQLLSFDYIILFVMMSNITLLTNLCWVSMEHVFDREMFSVVVGGPAHSSSQDAGREYVGGARLRDHITSREADTGTSRAYPHQLDDGPRAR